MLVRLTVTASLLLSGVALTACDDNDKIPSDGCTGHACGGTGAAIGDPEGGNLILERMTVDSEVAAAFMLPPGERKMTRVIAYFMSAHNPNSNPLPTPGICNNLEVTKGWPAHVGTQRTDVDVGTLTLKGKNATGGDVSIVIPKGTGQADQIGRPHNVFYQYVAPGVDQLKPDSSYSVTFGGVAGGMPETTFENVLYLAPDYPAVMTPGIEDNGPLIAGTDFPVSWTPPPAAANPPPAGSLIGGEVLGLTWLLDITGDPTHACIVPASAGGFTIPGATITEWKAVVQARGQPTNKMIMLRNAVAHTLGRLPTTDANNQRRIDFVSLECWAQVMDVQ